MNLYKERLPQSVLVVAGEASGEMYAAKLVNALENRVPGFASRFFGCGGESLRKMGVEIIIENSQFSVLGPFEAISHLSHFFTSMNRLVLESKRRNTQFAILVDFPDFNIPLAKRLKKNGIGIIYFVSPQLWAWRKSRIHKLKKVVDQMIVILPFEKQFYAKYGMQVKYFGHPLVDHVKVSCSHESFLKKYQLDRDVLNISLLPGSRKKEIQFNLPTMLRVAQRIQWERPSQFLVPIASSEHRDMIDALKQSVVPDLSMKIIQSDTYNTMAYSNLAVVSSGTATLETALLNTPLIAVFRISSLSWIVGKCLIDVPYYSLVNLIAGRKIIPELYQQNFTEEKLYEEIQRLLNNSVCDSHVRMGLAEVREKLGSRGAIEKIAEFVETWIRG